MTCRGVDPVRLRLGGPGNLAERILAALKAKGAAVTMAEVEELIASGGVIASGDPTTVEAVDILRPIPDEVDIPLRLIAETEDLVVVDKPAGLSTTPKGAFVARSVLVQARRQFDPDLSPAHRLDRATSGVLVLTRDTPRRGHYQQQFQSGAHKTYEFLSAYHVEGGTVSSHIRPGDRRMIEVDEPANSTTEITYLGPCGEHARYRAVPLTGRTHQIRLHAARIGAPIEGDTLYQGGPPPDAISLHARSVRLDGQTFESLPPWIDRIPAEES